jgi:hypothetical protein
MVSGSTFAQRRAIAPLDRKDRMEMSSGDIPVVAVKAEVAHRRCRVRVAVVICCHCEPLW